MTTEDNSNIMANKFFENFSSFSTKRAAITRTDIRDSLSSHKEADQ